MIADIDKQKNIFLEIGEFVTYITRELDAPELTQISTNLSR